MPTLMDNYKVMIYNGQLDIILGPAACEYFLTTLKWSGSDAYKNADRIIWHVRIRISSVTWAVHIRSLFALALCCSASVSRPALFVWLTVGARNGVERRWLCSRGPKL